MFVEENLLFYTVFFQEFLSRVFRMDLTTPFNACMLYRMAKVSLLIVFRRKLVKCLSYLNVFIFFYLC